MKRWGLYTLTFVLSPILVPVVLIDRYIFKGRWLKLDQAQKVGAHGEVGMSGVLSAQLVRDGSPVGRPRRA